MPEKTDSALPSGDTAPEVSTDDGRAMRHPFVVGALERVHYVADLMAAGLWNERTSRRMQLELSLRWGVATSTVRNYSTEASRSIQNAIIERRAAVAQRAIDRLEKVGGLNIATPGIPGLAGAIVHANEVLLKLSGFAEPEQDKLPSAGPAVVINMTGASEPGSETPGAKPPTDAGV